MERTAAGFIAVGANVPGGEQARSTPLIFLFGQRDQLGTAGRGAAAPGRGRRPALDIRYAAASGKLILIAGDVVTTKVAGKPKRTVTVQAGAAWLSGDGGSTWAPTAGSAVGPALPPGPGAQPQVAGVAAAGRGFVLLRPATVAKRPAVDAYYSPNGLAWTFQATLSAAGGFTAAMANGGPDGAVVTGSPAARRPGPDADRVRLRGRPGLAAGPPLRRRRVRKTVSGVALAPDGAVVTAGISAGPDSRQPVITLTGTGAAAQRVDIAKIPGAVEPQVAVNSVAAQGSTQVAVGSANGFPAAWTSVNGGSSWNRAAGASPAVLSRPGTQQLTSVTHGNDGMARRGRRHGERRRASGRRRLGRRQQLAGGRRRAASSARPGCSPSRRRPAARATSSSATRTSGRSAAAGPSPSAPSPRPGGRRA